MFWLLLNYDFPEEYDIEIIDDSEFGDLIYSKKLIMDVTENSTYVSFRKSKKSDPILNLPIQSIHKTEPFVHSKGSFMKRDSPAIEMSFEQSSIGFSTTKTIRFYISETWS